jgi:ABC-type Na+ efflux pump permease subunit
VSLREVLRIARWEVGRGVGDLDRREAAIALVVAILLGAVLVPVAIGGGVTIDRGLYRVGVSQDSPFHAPVTDDPALAVVPPDEGALAAGDVEILIDDDINVRDTAKGRAALERLRRTVQRHNVELMQREAQEGREEAAFPVTVTLVYSRQTGEGGEDDGGDDGGVTDGSDGGENASGGSSIGEGGFPTPSAPSVADGGPAGFFQGAQRASTPASITPPFPFTSLLLAFLFLIPMNFVIQAYSSSLMDERVNRRGELLLVSPVASRSIVAGKTLPYFAVAMAVAAGIALLIGGGVVSLGAMVPVALAYLATSFVGAMFARSFKELTFVSVAISVLLTTYLFVPAIFSQVHPIAAISPLTLVVRELQREAVTLVDYVFSTGPLYLSSLVLFALGVGVYREEDMFTQRSVPLKALDAIASQLVAPRSLLTVNVLFIPFVLVAELLVLATLFALPIGVSLPVLLIAIAGVEEVAKSAPVVAGFSHRIFDSDLRSALLLGGLSGLGFFLAEKLLIVVQLVGIPDLELGQAAFAVGPGAGLLDASLPVMAAVAAAPLLLHVATAATSAVGASRGRRGYAVGLVVAIGGHASYNIAVVSLIAV